MQVQAILKPVGSMAEAVLPTRRGLYYAGQWHAAPRGGARPMHNPATGALLCEIADADEQDVNAAVAGARLGFAERRQVLPLERAKLLREIATRLRGRGDEFAMLDAVDGGNPVRMLRGDIAAGLLDYFAGLVSEMKGVSIPMGRDAVNFSTREPHGVVARIIPFNHL